MVAVRDHLADLPPDPVVALVTFSSGPLLADYVARHRLPFVVLSDPQRRAYRAYGLERGTRARVWGWRAARSYLRIIRRDGVAGLRRPVEDPLQLGGDFVVAPDGTLVHGYWSEGPDDRPSVEELLAAVQAAAS